MLLTHYQWGSIDQFVEKFELISWKLNFIQMKLINNIARNLNWIEFKYIE